MAWQDRLRQGSFRGARFHVEDHKHASGRRVHLHEYPGKDEPYPEDLGRKAREFEVQCYVIGPDYMAARDALIDACEAAGPGTLVHPYFGTRRVQCMDCEETESAQRGGIALFTLKFVEAGANRYPVAEADTAAAVAGVAAEAEQALVGQFVETFTL